MNGRQILKGPLFYHSGGVFTTRRPYGTVPICLFVQAFYGTRCFMNCLQYRWSSMNYFNQLLYKLDTNQINRNAAMIWLTAISKEQSYVPDTYLLRVVRLIFIFLVRYIISYLLKENYRYTAFTSDRFYL